MPIYPQDGGGGGGGVNSINGDNTAAQTLAINSLGTDVALVDGGSGAHTLSIPSSSAVNRGVLTSTDWSSFNSKLSPPGVGTYLLSTNNLSDVALAATARTNLGLGSIATQASNNVNITGGTMSGVTITGHSSLDLQIANNLSDLNNTTTARTNLGVAIGTNVQAYDANLTTWAAKTAPTGTVAGLSDSQTFTNKKLDDATVTFADTGDPTKQVAFQCSGIAPATLRTVTVQDSNGTMAYLSDIVNVTPAALTKVDDTNVTLTLGGTPATSLLQATSLTLGWAGTLGLSRGGLGADLSGTGGASKVLKQTTLGGAITVAQLSASDLSDGTTGSGSVVLNTSPSFVTPTLGIATATSILTPLLDRSTSGTLVLGGTATTIQLAAGVTLSGAAGAGALSFGSLTGNTTLPTGSISWTAAASKSLSLAATTTATITSGTTATFYGSSITNIGTSLSTTNISGGNAINIQSGNSADLLVYSGQNLNLRSANNGAIVINSGFFNGAGNIRFEFNSTVCAYFSSSDQSFNLSAGKNLNFDAGSGGLALGSGTGAWTMPTGTGTVTSKRWVWTPAVSTGSTSHGFVYTGALDTSLTASTEKPDWDWNASRTVQFATGALTTQRAFVFREPTYAFVAASTLTNAATVAISGSPVAGTNATLTNSYSLWVQAGITKLDGNLSFGSGLSISSSSGDLSLNAAAILNLGTSNTTTVNLGRSGQSIGFYGVTAVTRAGAYTQTYSTASRTNATQTQHTLTDNSAGTPSTTQITTIGTNALGAEPADVRNNFATLAAELVLIKADLDNCKQNINSLIDDSQAIGIAQ